MQRTATIPAKMIHISGLPPLVKSFMAQNIRIYTGIKLIQKNVRQKMKPFFLSVLEKKQNEKHNDPHAHRSKSLNRQLVDISPEPPAVKARAEQSTSHAYENARVFLNIDNIVFVSFFIYGSLYHTDLLSQMLYIKGRLSVMIVNFVFREVFSAALRSALIR